MIFLQNINLRGLLRQSASILPAMLLAAGLAMPMAACLGLLPAFWPAAALWACLPTLAGKLLQRLRGGRLLSSLLCIAAMIAVCLAADAGQLVLSLRLLAAGQPDAVLLFASPLAALCGLLAAFLSLITTSSHSAPGAAILPTGAAAAALWLCGRQACLWLLFPAVAAALWLLALQRHEFLMPVRAAAAALVLTLAAFALAPSGGIVYPPLKQAAENFRQAVHDRLFFTEPREVFSISAEGFYPQSQHQLGGPAQPNDRVVMQVKTPTAVYLRGTIRDTYTGRCWTDSTGGRRYLWDSFRWTDRREQIFDMTLPRIATVSEETLQIHVISPLASSMPVPQRVRQLAAGGNLVPYFNQGSEIFATRNLQPGDTYTVTAPLFTSAQAEEWVRLCAAEPDSLYPSLVRAYTVLPNHLQSMVWMLAEEITQDCETPFEKAEAIAAWLRANCIYTLDAPEQDPGIDFVTEFLFRTRSGYCTYYASAMTVLCRMVGLPARYVEGYLAVPQSNGIATVTGEDAHAWTEVYFNGFGWLTFDATPMGQKASSQETEGANDEQNDDRQPASTPTPPPAEQSGNEDAGEQEQDTQPDNEPTNGPEKSIQDAPTPLPENEPSSPPQDTPEPREAPKPEVPSGNVWPWLLLLLIVGALIARLVLTDPSVQASRAKTEAARWTIRMQSLFDALAVKKLTRSSGETPAGLLARAALEPVCGKPLTVVRDSLSVVLYGHAEPLASETESAAQCTAAVLKRFTSMEKLAFRMRRAFVPLKSRRFDR